LTNETYHILGASIRAARFGIGSGVIILVKRQHKGKTHTSKIICRDNSPNVLRIPPGTETGIYEYLINTNAYVYYIDDKSKWSREEYVTGLRYIKLLTDGEKAPLKMTHYTREQVQDPVPTKSWSWILLNKPQFDASLETLSETGVLARAIMIRSGHTAKEFAKIQDSYEKYNWDGSNLPALRIHEDWYSSAPRSPSLEEKTMIKQLPEDMQSNVLNICKVMSEEGFCLVFDCIAKSASGQYYDEEIEFNEPTEIKK